ncbi:MAG: translation elongation factor Ts [Candidatus Pacebacteria bacterium]|nr:translation elongation factor Ts [Candidatus Paceibacterota bacterium]
MENTDLLKQLREETGISMMECKKALEESNWDIKRAKEILREKGKEMIKSRSDRTMSKGIVEAYIHMNGKIGVMLELLCESDFVAKSDEFKKLAHEIALQAAATRPLFVKPEDISGEFLDNEIKIYKKQFEGSGKPENIVNQIIEGKVKKYKEEVSLMNQPWVKDTSKTIQDLITEARAKIGENITVGKFSRFEI